MDTAGFVAGVMLPNIAKGIILRRSMALGMAERLDLDRRAIRTVVRLRHRYGQGPVLLNLFGRKLAVILDSADLRHVLANSPEPFASSTPEKRSVLTHFQPKGVLVSHGAEREDRRRVNEQALEFHSPVHRLAEPFQAVIASEAAPMLRNQQLDWTAFSDGWFRMVRRITFGEVAAEDHELSSIMAALRSAANWGFLHPKRSVLREELLARIRRYLEHAEPETLAGAMAQIPKTAMTAPEHQVPQWLFAFDAAAMATFRSLALLATHGIRTDIPFLRATVLESLRLWPTTPMILRQTTEDTTWRNGVMSAGTGVVIFTPYFHRDPERVPFADRFAPEVWLDGDAERRWPFVPFSDGPGTCPARHLVLLLATGMLSQLLSNADFQLTDPTRLGPDKPLGSEPNHYTLRFHVRR